MNSRISSKLSFDYERHFYPSSKTVQRLYIGGDRYTAPAVCVCEDDVWTMYYILRDYLGSITHIVRADGELKQELSYDAWGNLRDPETHEVYKAEEQPELFLHRGYTGHEHLQWFNLINMNGRIYDPVLSRFLNPDPVVQKQDFTQNFNRYTYCLNNPFKYKDPSGKSIISAFFFGFVRALFKGENVLKGGFNAVLNSLKIYAGLFIPDKKKDFFGKVVDIISRFTWELPQTFVGYIFSQIKNIYFSVDVRFYGGATFVIRYKEESDSYGVTIGNYINIKDGKKGARESNKDFDPTIRQLYMHEYGHYLQSKLYGPSYLFVIGLPSLTTSLFNMSHKYRWYEMNANWRGMEYFGIDRETWEEMSNGDYPLENPLDKYR